MAGNSLLDGYRGNHLLARFPGMAHPQPERERSWVDDWIAEGDNPDQWMFNNPRIRGSDMGREWPVTPLVPMPYPVPEARTPSFDPRQLWPWPWTQEMINAPWRRPQGL